MSHNDRTKYRPVLTASQISHIISLCKRDGSSASMLVIGVLAPFEYKIQNGSVSAAYVGEPEKDLVSDLGFGLPGELPNRNLSDKVDTYELWRIYPDKLTPNEIKTARDYAFTNNLLTPEELAQYNHDLFGI